MSGPQSDERAGERSLEATGVEGKRGGRGARIPFQGALLLILCALICYGDDGFTLPTTVSRLEAPAGSFAGMGPLIVLCLVALAAAARNRKEAPRGRLGGATFLLLLIATLTAGRGIFLARPALPIPWLDLYGILPAIVSVLALSVTCSIGFGVLCIGALAAVSGFADPSTSVWRWELAYLTAGAGMPALFLGSMAHTRMGLVFAAAAGGLGLALADVARRIVVEGWEPLKGGPVPEGLATSVTGISVGLLGAAIVLVFMPAIEPLLGRTSNLTIAGLLRLDHPVLLWLKEKAPGTYHHSLNVGALAAAAARRTGANPLLAQAGGHFHDLGKVNKPSFFMENIREKNPHDDISPAESAEIILAHATDGFEIARKKGLPPEVAAITREHQGTTLVEWFYKKATELGEDVKESNFRYGGPKPQSKEAALVMLADAVEAISRTLDSPDRGSLARAIDYILEKKRVEGQLEDSAIRSSHLPEIREAFLESLLDIHHRRVKYPGNPTEPGKSTSPGDTPGPGSPGKSRGDTSR